MPREVAENPAGFQPVVPVNAPVPAAPEEQPGSGSGSGSCSGSGLWTTLDRPLRLDDSVRDQVGEDARGVEPGEAGERKEGLVVHGPVDLGEQEPGPMVEVQPEDLLGLDGEARDRRGRTELRLVHRDERGFVLAEVVARLSVIGVHLEDLLDELEGAREVAQREQLLRGGEPHVDVVPRRDRRPPGSLGNERPQVRLLGDGAEVQPSGRLEDDGRRGRRAVVPRGGGVLLRSGRPARSSGAGRRRDRRRCAAELVEVRAGPRVPRLEAEHLPEGGARVLLPPGEVGLDPAVHEVGDGHHFACGRAWEASPLKSWRVRSSPSSSRTSAARSRVSRAVRTRDTTPSAFCTASLPNRVRSSASCTAGSSVSISARAAWTRSRFSSNSPATAFRSSRSSICSSRIRRSSSSVRPEVAVTVIDCCWPVSTSRADTPTIPSALISKVTSMDNSPRRAGRIPSRMNSPSSSLSMARSLSPWSTAIRTETWLSCTVVKRCVSLVGTVVFFGMTVWK